MKDVAKRFYNLVVDGEVADIDIYGDITSWEWLDSDMSSYTLAQRLAELEGVSQINVNINSYGGEVAEGIAIYNALVRHGAKIVTRCDGMACSIASVIFMAGQERIMYAPSMLMIHNASSFAYGTAAQLRKAAEDNEKITSMSKAAYMSCVNITEKELSDLMDAETWISPAEALEMGFATCVEARSDMDEPSQCARLAAYAMIERARMAADEDPDDEDDPPTIEPEEPDPDDSDPEGTDPEEPDDIDPDDPEDPDDTDPDEEPEEDPDKKNGSSQEHAFAKFLLAAF